MKRRLHYLLAALSLGLAILLPCGLAASDYKPWIPMLPPELDGLKKKERPQGMNMEINGEKWSSLTQVYGEDDREAETTLTIVCGTNAPQMQHFKSMPKMKMETDDQIMMTLQVAGRDAFMTLDKAEKTAFLMILVDEMLLVTLEMQECAEKEKLLSAAGKIPFDKFKCSAK